ncbi:MAG: histidine phosphatase family protein, partial [Gammaproteobacteria bacterium]|nr:histidine phosphatase family protein [Gammaproteobacteria bacterium]
MDRHELLILRHAKSAWNTGAPSDFERPLSKRGRRDAPRMGRFLARENLRPDYVVSSPATRARQTVVAVCSELDITEQEIHWDDRIYHASTGALMDVLSESPEEASRVLIAGHNPGLEVLVQTLSRAPVPMPGDWKLMPTAAVAHLDIPGRWCDLDG